MDSHPVVEQLLLICPQHSKYTIESTVDRYRAAHFSDAELLQICLDDLVDLPDLNGLNTRGLFIYINNSHIGHGWSLFENFLEGVRSVLFRSVKKVKIKGINKFVG